jgi:hypothetical protein
MTDESRDREQAVEKEREMREHEREARERDPDEAGPQERSAGAAGEPGGTPAMPVQKSPGS